MTPTVLGDLANSGHTLLSTIARSMDQGTISIIPFTVARIGAEPLNYENETYGFRPEVFHAISVLIHMFHASGWP